MPALVAGIYVFQRGKIKNLEYAPAALTRPTIQNAYFATRLMKSRSLSRL